VVCQHEKNIVGNAARTGLRVARPTRLISL